MVVSANLKQLPPEIVDMICDLLPVQDVAALELVSATSFHYSFYRKFRKHLVICIKYMQYAFFSELQQSQGEGGVSQCVAEESMFPI